MMIRDSFIAVAIVILLWLIVWQSVKVVKDVMRLKWFREWRQRWRIRASPANNRARPVTAPAAPVSARAANTDRGNTVNAAKPAPAPATPASVSAERPAARSEENDHFAVLGIAGLSPTEQKKELTRLFMKWNDLTVHSNPEIRKKAKNMIALVVECQNSLAGGLANNGAGSSSSNQERKVSDISTAGVQLWEGGPYWATCNIGAAKPEDSGYYFWWGDTVGYKHDSCGWRAVDGSDVCFEFDADNAKAGLLYGQSIEQMQRSGALTDSGVLTPEHDAARKHLGDRWRMPTKEEFDYLVNNCGWTWTTKNGVDGYQVDGAGSCSENSIFLPAAGRGYRSSLYEAGSDGSYCSSTPFAGDSHYSWFLSFGSGGHGLYSCGYRHVGRSVRPVSDSAD